VHRSVCKYEIEAALSEWQAVRKSAKSSASLVDYVRQRAPGPG